MLFPQLSEVHFEEDFHPTETLCLFSFSVVSSCEAHINVLGYTATFWIKPDLPSTMIADLSKYSILHLPAYVLCRFLYSRTLTHIMPNMYLLKDSSYYILEPYKWFDLNLSLCLTN
jgi:hypothetical protein